MTRSDASAKPPIFQIATVQVVVGVLLSLLSLLVQGWTSTTLIAVLAGMLAAMLPSIYFNWRSFAHLSASGGNQLDGSQILAELFRAEIGKVLIAAVLLALLFKFGCGLDKTLILASFIATLLAGSIATARMTDQVKPES